MNTDTIQIWHGTIAAEDADYPSYWQTLDAEEQARAEKFKNDLLRNRYVKVHGRLRKLLARILNEPPEKINIKTAEHGKPYLADAPELSFNLSDSGDVMVIAVGLNCRIGVDIECCNPRNSLVGLVDKCFADEEIAYWNAQPEAQQTVEFYRFWTRKEAFVKATGHGISLGLSLCVVNPENPAKFLRVPEACGEASIWHAQDLKLGQGVCSALVADKNIVEVQIMEFDS